MSARVKVYVVNVNKMFMAGGENVGITYSPEEFQLEFNSGRIDPETNIIRFIKEPKKKKL